MTLGDRLLVLHQGRPVHLATPMEVFERPANTYVAGFIGAPAMNFLPATLSHGGTAASFAPGQVIAFADGRRHGADGRRLTLGIRPEHVVADAAGMALQIDLIEPLGSETVLIGRLPDGTLFSIKLANAASGGESMAVRIPPEHLHVFDAQTGLRLDPAG
jgi:sn-glycerol 3-phosphate transport system ATP-binding protein